MTQEHETAYRRLPADLGAADLESLFTPTAADLAFIRSIADQPLRQFTAMVQLKTAQHLGRLAPIGPTPERIARHIAHAMGFRRAFRLADLDTYDRSRMRDKHVSAIRDHLKLRRLGERGRDLLAVVAREAARTRHYLADIINVMLEELIRHSYELPAFGLLDAMAGKAREDIHETFFKQIDDSLSSASKETIASLLTVAPGMTSSGWQALKREPRKPGNKEVRYYLAHVQRLRTLADSLPPVDIPIAKLKFFRDWARAKDAAELAEYHPAKRHALAVIFIRSQYNKTLDDAAELFIRLLQNLENVAQKNLMTYQAEHMKRTDALVAQLKETLQAYQLEGTAEERITAIEGSLERAVSLIVADCNEHLAYAGQHFIPFLERPYAAQRALLLNCLAIMQLRSTSSDDNTARLLEVLEYCRDVRRDSLALSELGLEWPDDFTWMSATWRKEAMIKNRYGPPAWVRRRFFELAALFHIKDELKSGDLFVPGANKFDDYRETLVDDAILAQELPLYGEATGLAVEPEQFVQNLRHAMRERCESVNRRFPANADASFVDGRLILRKPQRPEVTRDIAILDAKLLERMEPTTITDVLQDVATWTGMERHFKPLAGSEAQVDNLLYRVVTTVFCYGCNLGPTQTARSLRDLSRKQAGWLNLKYVTDEVLERATKDIINVYNRYELPGYWGSGQSASADGTKWSMYEQNTLSQYHLRYGGYGGIGYYHVSDKYIALLSRFIACGTYEAIYILDVLQNDSDIQPKTIHGDTQAQSFPVFALAYLLGIDLMPRIRNLRDLSFSRPDAGTAYPHLHPLFGDGVIDWDLIQTHLPDMQRVAVSIKTGKITASTILRRLGTASRKNKLYFAFRELGRVIRTMFLLRYIDSAEIRQMITAATNKSEEFNNFAQWAFFGGQGIIAENLRHEQEKVIGYNHLVANMVILHNVEHMTRAIGQLQVEGHEITPEVLAGLSPYRTAHINRFGDYTVDLTRAVVPHDASRRLLTPQATEDVGDPVIEQGT
ncbi:Transposase and inactivated derivatives, TnpA family [Dyella jiangningensis]|uniref:Tn3 family transposase n=1 Tax=Dyella sp. AtDHG13 TaxID=1938897 RepID=UPI000882D4C2|nr:Tn3 family transposase [Dyella sp. AtDHG13]PXV55927.1 TnpA family transposase [Dyella sp. AtDHG13]SDK50460.1 Transposase and inactivated derivatives, TnpA family [Dyella jiangningensis]